eukprot:TRINITY_DN10530_c0_g2_i1.p1 TRINITY_DN10530_c0_g2~~TRINITY_DN10530_c0_g2_i1.p1  ORF type:complete len:409 (-),score=35.77 TRINITY_DN10530_c0_g2_i1:999-2063(-)
MPGEIPQVDITPWLKNQQISDEQSQQLATEIAQSFITYGVLIVRDPRVSTNDSNCFLDMMERYFGQPYQKKLEDQRPDVYYQVGVTPCDTELPRSAWDEEVKKMIESLPENMKPIIPTQRDCKWRYMWKLGDRPENTDFCELHPDPVIPEGFPEWREVMDTWGNKLRDACASVSELLAIGLGLPQHTLKDKMNGGPHVLAPTGSDLDKYGKLNQILAGFHNDLGYITVHGKSRFPGLYIWLKDGSKMAVKVPNGCLLMQAGQQLEYLTGGLIRAGYHEVIVSENTLKAIEDARQQQKSLWRISSTVFVHILSDVYLEPLDKFGFAGAYQKYPRILAGTQVKEELEAIKLKVPQN